MRLFILPLAAIASWTAQGSRPASPHLAHLHTLPDQGEVYFGAVTDMDVWPDGSVVVLDGLSHTLLLFGSDGAHRATIGREGEGPGEIGGSEEIELGPDGTIALVDYGNLRITRWSREGELLGSIPLRNLSPETFWPHDFMLLENAAYLKVSRFIPTEPVRVYRLSSDLDSVVDVVTEFLPDDNMAATCIFCPTTAMADGIVGAAGDTVYRIALLDGAGRARVEWSRSDLPAVLRSQDELDHLNAASRRYAGAEPGSEGSSGSRFSAHRPRFVRKALAFDSGGRLWALPTQSEGANGVADVFDSAGNYLTSWEFDHPVDGIKIRNGFLLASGLSDLGEPVLHVYRVIE